MYPLLELPSMSVWQGRVPGSAEAVHLLIVSMWELCPCENSRQRLGVWSDFFIASRLRVRFYFILYGWRAILRHSGAFLLGNWEGVWVEFGCWRLQSCWKLQPPCLGHFLRHLSFWWTCIWNQWLPLNIQPLNNEYIVFSLLGLNGSGKTIFPCFPLLKPGISEG